MTWKKPLVTEPWALCVCGHTKKNHAKRTRWAKSITTGKPIYFCCAGDWYSSGRRCRCPFFRVAVAQLNVEEVENAGPT